MDSLTPVSRLPTDMELQGRREGGGVGVLGGGEGEIERGEGGGEEGGGERGEGEGGGGCNIIITVKKWEGIFQTELGTWGPDCSS